VEQTIKGLRVGLTLFVLTVTLAAPGGSRTSAAPVDELLGACYCRAAGDLHCLGQLTERACDRRCKDELCDDWYWLERRACWNWGYGG
jgi:hypothetical protein